MTCRRVDRADARAVDHTEVDASVVAVARDQHVSEPPRHVDRPRSGPSAGAPRRGRRALRRRPGCGPGARRRSSTRRGAATAISRGAPRMRVVGARRLGREDVESGTGESAALERQLAGPPRPPVRRATRSRRSRRRAGARARGPPIMPRVSGGERHVERDDVRRGARSSSRDSTRSTRSGTESTYGSYMTT